MAIETLKKPARCSECGALLKPGTRVKVYEKSDGTRLIYGFTCHKRKVNEEEKQDQPEELKADWDFISGQLADIQSMLMQIIDILSARKEALSENDTDLTAADWRKFWMKVKQMGFDEKQVHEIYNTDSMKKIIKSREDMERVLSELKEIAF